jgi:hypothetical protein
MIFTTQFFEADVTTREVCFRAQVVAWPVVLCRGEIGASKRQNFARTIAS